MSDWTRNETWDGDYSYDSPRLTYDGRVRFIMAPGNIKGAALTVSLQHGDTAFTAVDMTIEEAREFRRVLLQAIEETELDAIQWEAAG